MAPLLELHHPSEHKRILEMAIVALATAAVEWKDGIAGSTLQLLNIAMCSEEALTFPSKGLRFQ